VRDKSPQIYKYLLILEISRFFGIVIRMFFNDHQPPHFHAEYEGVFNIVDLRMIEGHFPGRVKMLILEWAFEHRNELIENWESARNKLILKPIEPLE
jgi:Domain of unknown function (DUF4160)